MQVSIGTHNLGVVKASVANTADYDLILGFTELQRLKPTIQWDTGQLEFKTQEQDRPPKRPPEAARAGDLSMRKPTLHGNEFVPAEHILQAALEDGPIGFMLRRQRSRDGGRGVLQHFDYHLSTRLETNASDFAIAGVLKQKLEGRWHPVAFYSRKMSSAEKNYEIHDKELLAVVACLTQWRHMLAGLPSQLVILTNHEALKYFKSQRCITGRQARWEILLADFDFILQYRPGDKGGEPDALTRRTDMQPVGEEQDHNVRQLLPPRVFKETTDKESTLVAPMLTMEFIASKGLKHLVKTFQPLDQELQEIHSKKPFEVKGGLWHSGGRLVIPKVTLPGKTNNQKDDVNYEKYVSHTRPKYYKPRLDPFSRTRTDPYVLESEEDISMMVDPSRSKPITTPFPKFNPQDVEIFILEAEAWFKFNQVYERTRMINHMGSQLEGNTHKWWISKIHINRAREGRLFHDWNHFTERLMEQFNPKNA
ncbi:hypothetical protein NDA18_002898 [Ustilago nuda]|nr:hypothetical protein NDA18_002898 [Ustilago nuda]